MAEPDYFRQLFALRAAGIVTDVGHGRGLRINRRAIKNAKAIDERAAMAAKRVKGNLSAWIKAWATFAARRTHPR
jgi:hypothetical protein